MEDWVSPMTAISRSGMMQTLTAGASITRLVGAIGEVRFGPALAHFLHDLCGADHFAAFRLEADELCEVGASCVIPERTAHHLREKYIKLGLWRRDPAMAEARNRLISNALCIVHIDLGDKGYTTLRHSIYPHVRDRLVLCSRHANGMFVLSILCEDSQSPFGHNAIDSVERSAELLMAILTKHAEVCQSRPNPSQALMTLAEIENCICATSSLPRREAEVCARILFGMSSVGIALDLEVSEETIKTYRKRIYQRLNISSKDELLTWYLAHWSHWRSYGFERQHQAVS